MNFGIRPVYYNQNSTHTNLDINILDTLFSKVWNFLPAKLKKSDNIYTIRKELCDRCLTDEATEVLKILDL